MDLEAEPHLFKIFSSTSPTGARRHFLPRLYICIMVTSLLASSPGSSGGGPGELVSRLHGDKFFDPWNMTCEGAEQRFQRTWSSI